MNLEDELGVKLFDRSRRNIKMTDAGIYLLKEAQQLLLHVEQAAETARRIYRGQAGRLTVGFVGSVLHTFSPEGLRLFRERFPDEELVLQELNTAEQIKSLHARRIDVGFHYPDAQDSTLASRSLTQAPLLVVLPGNTLCRSGNR